MALLKLSLRMTALVVYVYNVGMGRAHARRDDPRF